MNRRSAGFSIVELIIVIIVGAILVSLAVRGFGGAMSTNSVRSARNNFQGLHARARALAIERGATAYLRVLPGSDRVLVYTAGDTVADMSFRSLFGVDVQAGGDHLLSMTPRGYPDLNDNNFNNTVTISFVQGQKRSEIRMLPMGQLRTQ